MLVGLVLEDMIVEDAFSDNAIGDEVGDILCRREAAASVLDVVDDVVFRIEVGCESCCARCSGDNGDCEVYQCLTLAFSNRSTDLHAMTVNLLRISFNYLKHTTFYTNSIQLTTGEPEQSQVQM